MKVYNLTIDQEQFKENYKNALLEYYGDKTEIKAEDDFRIIFKIPFAHEYFSRVLFDRTTVKIGKETDISGTDINSEFLFSRVSSYTTENKLILNGNSISLMQVDSSNSYGGNSIYSFINTDKGLVFFSALTNTRASSSSISACKSIHVESGLDLTPVTFGNQVLSDENEVLKQPFRLTDKNGEIYTAIDIYNISYKPDSLIILSKSVITDWNLASKDNPQEPIATSLLMYDEED